MEGAKRGAAPILSLWMWPNVFCRRVYSEPIHVRARGYPGAGKHKRTHVRTCEHKRIGRKHGHAHAWMQRVHANACASTSMEMTARGSNKDRLNACSY